MSEATSRDASIEADLKCLRDAVAALSDESRDAAVAAWLAREADSFDRVGRNVCLSSQDWEPWPGGGGFTVSNFRDIPPRPDRAALEVACAILADA